MNDTNLRPQAGANHSAAIGSATNPVFRPPRGKRKPPTSSRAHRANANGMLPGGGKRRAKPTNQAIRRNRAVRPGFRPAAGVRGGSGLEKKIETEPPAPEAVSISATKVAHWDFPQGPLGSHMAASETFLAQRPQNCQVSILICLVLPGLGRWPPEPRFCH